MVKKIKKILVTGAAGQIGSELTLCLRKKYGSENVLATDIKRDIHPKLARSGPYAMLDVTNRLVIKEIIKKHSIDVIYHMSAILSALGEMDPQLAWNVNINGTYNILEAAREFNLSRIFIPSSIAVFGPEVPKEKTPQEPVLKPKTIYGISKVTGELLCDYYVQRFGMDIRGCRYPGIISYEALPGGGTTDYAVAIFYEAVRDKKYTCYVKKDTMLPMMYMPDCLKATIQLMEADFSKLIHHADFNISGMTFSVEELANEIKKRIPEFKIEYKPDYRQKIAESWPQSIDDSAAQKEWGWKPAYDLALMTKDMLAHLQKRHAKGKL